MIDFGIEAVIDLIFLLLVDPLLFQASTAPSDYAEMSSFRADVAKVERIYEEYYNADDWTDVADDASVWELDETLYRVLHAPEMDTIDFHSLFKNTSRITCSDDGRLLIIYSPDIGAKFDVHGTLTSVARLSQTEISIEESFGFGAPKGVYQPDIQKPYYLILHSLFENHHNQIASAYTLSLDRQGQHTQNLEDAFDGYYSIYDWDYDQSSKTFHYSYELYIPGYAGASEEEAAAADSEIRYEGSYVYRDGQFLREGNEEEK